MDAFDGRRSKSRRHHARQQLLQSFYSDEPPKPATPADHLPALNELDDTPGSHDIAKISASYGSDSTEDLTRPEAIARVINSPYASGDRAKAVELLNYFRDAVEGILVPITHPAKSTASLESYSRLEGADNLKGVTCYLDTLLFAMFARVENFEPILYKSFDTDDRRENLATMLRLYVNLMRSGKLITTDVTQVLLDTIFTAGWTPGMPGVDSDSSPSYPKRYEQQDAADLFNFIADKLSMPLLTLKVDIAHAGKEDAADDHKLVKERLLLVPVPGTPDDPPVLLEECLEHYFANSVNVSRQLDPQRKNSYVVPPMRRARKFSFETIDRLPRSFTDMGPHRHDSISGIPLRSRAATSTSFSVPGASGAPGDQLPTYESLYTSQPPPELPPPKSNPSLFNSNNEISLPAWMFLQLLPFYTEHNKGATTSHEAAVEDYFRYARPILGICLKRYGWSESGRTTRNSRQVLVPQTIHLPSFVADDSDGTGTFGSFQLVLESAIFHRGSSIESGHFVAITGEDASVAYDRDLSAELEDLSLDPRPVEERRGLFGSRKSRRHRTYLKTQQPMSQPPSQSPSQRASLELPRRSLDQDRPSQDRSSASSSGRRRWIMFDDLKPPGEKTREVDFDETFAREMPYLLFYRMVSVNENPLSTATSLSPRSTFISPTNSIPDLSLSQLNTRLSEPDTTHLAVPALPDRRRRSDDPPGHGTLGAEPGADGVRGRDSRHKHRRGLFSLGSRSPRSISAPPDKHEPRANPGDSQPGSGPRSGLSQRSLRKADNYNVDEKCTIC